MFELKLIDEIRLHVLLAVTVCENESRQQISEYFDGCTFTRGIKPLDLDKSMTYQQSRADLLKYNWIFL